MLKSKPSFSSVILHKFIHFDVLNNEKRVWLKIEGFMCVKGPRVVEELSYDDFEIILLIFSPPTNSAVKMCSLLPGVLLALLFKFKGDNTVFYSSWHNATVLLMEQKHGVHCSVV